MNSKFAVRYRWDAARKSSYEPRVRIAGHWDLVRQAAGAPSLLAADSPPVRIAHEEDAGGGSGIRTPDTRIMIPLL